PMTPTTGLTRKQAEALDQRRNWLLQSPDAILKQATERDDPRARDSREDREAPKSVTERFLEGSEGKNDPEQKLKPGETKDQQARAREREREREAKGNRGSESREGRDTLEKPLASKSGEARTGLETRGPGGLRGADSGFFGSAEARGAMSRAVNEARQQERQRERDASLEAFKRNFQNPWAQTTSAGAGSLLPAGGAASGPLGLPGADLRRATSVGGLNPGGRGPTDFGPRDGGLDNFDPKNPLNYGAAETVLKNNEPVRSAPKPVVLELPKRKF
ncbi:MAG: hypothetical protein ACKODH_08540, partial [Limisphaerales bacterium]